MSNTKVEFTNSLAQQADIKENGSMQQSEMLKSMSSDDELVAGRLRNSSIAIEAATKRFNKAGDDLLIANSSLMDQCISIENKSKKACAGVKSSVNQIKDQLIKVDSILGDNVEHKINQLERIATALQSINEISQDKATMSIIESMVNK